MIGDLPTEVLEEIFNYCSTEDLLNFACTCQCSYYSVKHMLWRNVKIGIYRCGNLPDILPNLKHTTSLHLYQGREKDFVAVAALDKNISRMNCAFNCAKVMNNIVPAELRTLKIRDVRAGECINYAFDVFYNITKLYLNNVNLENWNRGNGFRDLLQKNQLVELHLYTIRNIIMDDISSATALKALTLNECTFVVTDDASKYSFYSLSKLVNLTYLNISDDETFANQHLIHLCQFLEKLKRLCIEYTNITGLGLSNIGSLNSLSELNISRGSFDLSTISCFAYITSVRTLRRFIFSYYPDGSVDSDILVSKLSNLNNYSLLQEIIIHADGETGLPHDILKALCSKRKWELRIEDDSTIDTVENYIFSRVR